MWFVFFYNLLKFDIVNVDISFCKRAHNLETEVKLHKARHPFSNKVSMNVGADFQLIVSENVHKRTKNVHPYMLFYFIDKKTKNVSWLWLGVKSTPHWQKLAWVSLTQQWLLTTWNKQMSTILAQKSVTVLSFEGQALKRFVCKLLWSLLHRRFCRHNWYYAAQLNTFSISRYLL